MAAFPTGYFKTLFVFLTSVQRGLCSLQDACSNVNIFRLLEMPHSSFSRAGEATAPGGEPSNEW